MIEIQDQAITFSNNDAASWISFPWRTISQLLLWQRI